MKKKIIKKLYTCYIVEDSYDNVKKAGHKLISYSCGKAECMKYHDDIISWLAELGKEDFKIGFGIKILSEDGENEIDHYKYGLTYNTWACANYPVMDAIRIINEIMTYFLYGDMHYYEIIDDGIYTRTEFTGHMYRNSPYETCDSCGNCDGARCETCRKRYTVINTNTDEVFYSGYDVKEAEKIRSKHKLNYTEIMEDIFLCYPVTQEFKKELDGHTDAKALYKLMNQYKVPHHTIR